VYKRKGKGRGERKKKKKREEITIAKMQNSIFTNVVLGLSLFYTAVMAGAGAESAPLIAVRQFTTTPTTAQCLDYSRIANLSTIGSNATLRAAYFKSSPAGTFSDATLLNNAMAKLPPMTNNIALNNACGNLTAVAAVESERNYSRGIVAQFSGITGNPQAVRNGEELLVIFTVISAVFSLTWMFMP
jgi:hypothetical protein